MTRGEAGPSGDADAFGRDALGPIFAEFCLRLWLFESFLPAPEDATLLFCARGGLRMKLVYERFLARTGLPSRLPAGALMVSRLIAARSALSATPLPDSVLEELGREFEGVAMRAIATALAQRSDIALPPGWDAPYEAGAFAALFAERDEATATLRDAISDQDRHFRTHLATLTGPRHHAILVDTGLYGSTVRLLSDGVEDRTWSGVHFARSNYKGLPTPHFGRTLGLSVESDFYRSWDARTSALRFWHLIEATLEPELPSVTLFTADASGREVRSNLEIDGWRSRLLPTNSGLFSGVLGYIDALARDDVRQIPQEAVRGWRRFKGSVVWPDARSVNGLSLPDRSRDFGRPDSVAQFAERDTAGGMRRIRDSLWREGAIRRRFPRTGAAGLSLLECVYLARGLRRAYRDRLKP